MSAWSLLQRAAGLVRDELLGCCPKIPPRSSVVPPSPSNRIPSASLGLQPLPPSPWGFFWCVCFLTPIYSLESTSKLPDSSHPSRETAASPRAPQDPSVSLRCHLASSAGGAGTRQSCSQPAGDTDAVCWGSDTAAQQLQLQQSC